MGGGEVSDPQFFFFFFCIYFEENYSYLVTETNKYKYHRRSFIVTYINKIEV